jgi:hypothetical protein
MRFKPSSDFWKVGIVPAPAELPDPGPWRYLADPFAIKRSDALHVFVEAYD